nr:hypothetical protein [Ligilactobacillus salivarius]
MLFSSFLTPCFPLTLGGCGLPSITTVLVSKVVLICRISSVYPTTLRPLLSGVKVIVDLGYNSANSFSATPRASFLNLPADQRIGVLFPFSLT